MRTIKELSNLEGRVYVYLANQTVGVQFLQQAETEGFTYCDGRKPTEREYEAIMAVNQDGTLNYVGANGRIAFGSGAERIGGIRLIRVDYAKYISGAEDYSFNKN